MAKHKIFLVHGMGKHPKGWSEPVQALLRECYGRYEGLKLLPFEQNFQFVEVCYDRHFDDLRKRWAKAAGEVVGLIKGAGLEDSFAGTLAGWAEEADKDDFLRTHVLDVVLYRLAATVGEEVRSSVIDQIMSSLNPGNDVLRWSVLAHSLGTAVAHDSLLELFTRKKGALKPEEHGLEVLMMVANVSRVLEDPSLYKYDVYRSIVRPSSSPEDGICRHYLNARHECDPVAKPKMFKPAESWPDPQARADGNYANLEIGIIEEADVHDFEHYLRNPKVHIELFRRLTAPGLIDKDAARDAEAGHAAHSPIGKFKKEVDELKKLSLADEEDNWNLILTMMRDYMDGFGRKNS
jgi:hypothetical protein